MQDRFRFRFFDKNQKKMVELDAVGYSSFDPFGKSINRLIMIPSGLNNTFSYNKQVLYENDNFTEPMQCTGLKDKNGKLIYEGDIVKDLIIPEIFYIVKWFNSGFHLESTISGSFLKFGTRQEIIGNIYENPELLKDGE